MENQAVVKGLAGLDALGEIGEVLHGVGRFVVEKFNFEAAFSCVEHRVGFSSHKLILAWRRVRVTDKGLVYVAGIAAR